MKGDVMPGRIACLCLALFSMTVPILFAAEPVLTDRARLGADGGFSSGSAAAEVDSVLLVGPWGSGAPVNGQFQNYYGYDPAWNDWTHRDATEPADHHWQVSAYMAGNLGDTPGNLAMYCGDETLPPCHAQDPAGGYGNGYNEALRYTYTVADPDQPAVFTISGVLNHDLEPGYDFVRFEFLTAGGLVEAAALDGTGLAIPFTHQLIYQPADLAGQEQDQVAFQIRVTSDGAWSDEDCLFPSAGACQVDDLHVVCDNGGLDATTDFQNGPGDWEVILALGTGDFSQIWPMLEDLDLCRSNYSPQVAFIDDGQVVPGVGPSYCLDWCYGPGGYVVNTTGGRFDNPLDHPLRNEIISPVLPWPGPPYDGLDFRFDAYLHENLGFDSGSVFMVWGVRSAVDPADIEQAPWRSRNFLYYGGPGYRRSGDEVGDLLVPGCTAVQVMMGVYQVQYIWPWWDPNATPAPYFDNVRVTAYDHGGPFIHSTAANLAQDGFPAAGTIDLENLARNAVRFDSAVSKDLPGQNWNVPGDSLVCRVTTRRAGAEIVKNRLYYTMRRNPLFDDVRDPAWDATGFVDGVAIDGQPDLFAYDLPDSGFLFPGDVLHYHFEARDAVGGDWRATTLPADLGGYGEFDDPRSYPAAFSVHALPSLLDEAGAQPTVLFWDDSGGRTDLDKWIGGLAAYGLRPGIAYDIYHTNAASSGLGNGLGGRADLATIAGYGEIFYSCGDLTALTLSDGDLNQDPGQDIQLLSSWLDLGGKDLFLCGDNLASDLHQSPAGSQFLVDALNVQWEREDIRPLIANQVTPLVRVEAGNPVFSATESWVAYGGCLDVNTFDGVLPGTGAWRLASFCDPAGQPDYPYSAATLHQREDGSRVLSLPFDLGFVYTDPTGPPPGGVLDVAHLLLQESLAYFEVPGPIGPAEPPSRAVFATANHPNPFNPRTRIDYRLPRAGRLEIKVFNLRGECVRTLLDEDRPAGEGHVVWDGTDARGAGVGSGVYFYEARHEGEARVGKMTLLK